MINIRFSRKKEIYFILSIVISSSFGLGWLPASCHKCVIFCLILYERNISLRYIQCKQNNRFYKISMFNVAVYILSNSNAMHRRINRISPTWGLNLGIIASNASKQFYFPVHLLYASHSRILCLKFNYSVLQYICIWLWFNNHSRTSVLMLFEIQKSASLKDNLSEADTKNHFEFLRGNRSTKNSITDAIVDASTNIIKDNFPRMRRISMKGKI